MVYQCNTIMNWIVDSTKTQEIILTMKYNLEEFEFSYGHKNNNIIPKVFDIHLNQPNNGFGVADCYNYIISKLKPTGKIFSVGDSALPHAILNLPYFRENIDKIDPVGLNLPGQGIGVFEHFEVKAGNAHHVEYDDETFDCVVSFMMLEHDPEFWMSLSEMRRVLKKGGLMIIGIPGYVPEPTIKSSDFTSGSGTITYETHGNPDCYRFSPHWCEYVAFNKFENIEINMVKLPVRLITSGYKPE